MLAIQLSVLFVLFFKTLLIYKNILLKSVLTVCLLTLFITIIVLQSRTAELALMSGTLYVSYPYLRNWYSKNKIIFVSTFVLIAATLLFGFFIKVESSAGRLFIWKNSLALLKNNWISGVGLGKFNPNYNHLQAEYFSKNAITSAIAMRADDGYYAFNEWLHFWIETGVAGFLFFLIITILSLRICLLNIRKKKNWYGAVLIPLIVSCLFSYPLHNAILLWVFIFFALYCFIDYFTINNIKKYFYIIFAVSFILWLMPKTYFYNQYQKAKNLEKEKYNNQAYSIAKKNFAYLKKDYRFTTFYSNLLYNTNRLDEVISTFNTIHPYHCNQILHTNVAKAYNEIGDSINAKKHFLTALYIAPYRLQSRQDLLEFYLHKKDTTNAKYWAREIINCPMKIVTSKGLYLKQNAKVFLDNTH